MIQNFSEPVSLGSGGPWNALARDERGALLLSPPAYWSALPVSLLAIPSQASWPGKATADPYLELALRGSGRRCYQIAGRKRDLLTSPRMLELCNAGLEIESAQWKGVPGVCIHVDFPRSSLARITRDDADVLALASRHEFFNERIAHVATELANEARNRLLNGALYSEGLSLCLVSLLTEAYGKPSRQRSGTGLGSHQMAKLVEYIESNIGNDLSIQRLADELDMSPFVLAKLFKLSFGCTPHRYVMSRRIEKASEELQQNRFETIGDIALAHGFSSHAHFTATYRKIKGELPTAVRPRAGRTGSRPPTHAP